MWPVFSSLRTQGFESIDSAVMELKNGPRCNISSSKIVNTWSYGEVTQSVCLGCECGSPWVETETTGRECRRHSLPASDRPLTTFSAFSQLYALFSPDLTST